MNETPLGTFLKDRRAKMDPQAFGFSGTRRRTPGLRREEVAMLANISATWYTWLEQGRGGAPSPDALNRIAKGLALSDNEREHLFILALGHPPEIRYRLADEISPVLQHVLNAMETSPAIIKNASWDVLAWNPAAAALLTDYGTLPADERNILKLFFCNRTKLIDENDWQQTARFLVGAFRADLARAGATSRATDLVSFLQKQSPSFASLWQSNEILSYAAGTKTILHPVSGRIAMDYSSFLIDGNADLSMIVYSPASDDDTVKIKTIMHQHQHGVANTDRASSFRTIEQNA